MGTSCANQSHDKCESIRLRLVVRTQYFSSFYFFKYRVTFRSKVQQIDTEDHINQQVIQFGTGCTISVSTLGGWKGRREGEREISSSRTWTIPPLRGQQDPRIQGPKPSIKIERSQNPSILCCFLDLITWLSFGVDKQQLGDGEVKELQIRNLQEEAIGKGCLLEPREGKERGREKDRVGERA